MSNELKKAISNLTETDLTESIVIPLIEKLHPGKVECTHSNLEGGRDIISYGTDTLGRLNVICIQVKTNKISYGAQKIGELYNVATTAKCTEVSLQDGNYVFPDEVWIITSKSFSENQRRPVAGVLKEMSLKNIKLIALDELASLLIQHLPKLAAKLSKYSDSEISSMISLLSKHNESRIFGFSYDKLLMDFYVPVSLSPNTKYAHLALNNLIDVQDFSESKSIYIHHIIKPDDINNSNDKLENKITSYLSKNLGVVKFANGLTEKLRYKIIFSSNLIDIIEEYKDIFNLLKVYNNNLDKNKKDLIKLNDKFKTEKNIISKYQENINNLEIIINQINEYHNNLSLLMIIRNQIVEFEKILNDIKNENKKYEQLLKNLTQHLEKDSILLTDLKQIKRMLEELKDLQKHNDKKLAVEKVKELESKIKIFENNLIGKHPLSRDKLQEYRHTIEKKKDLEYQMRINQQERIQLNKKTENIEKTQISFEIQLSNLKIDSFTMNTEMISTNKSKIIQLIKSEIELIKSKMKTVNKKLTPLEIKSQEIDKIKKQISYLESTILKIKIDYTFIIYIQNNYLEVLNQTIETIKKCPKILNKDYNKIKEAYEQIHYLNEFVKEIIENYNGKLLKYFSNIDEFLRIDITKPLNIIKLSNFILIEGPPGCGKTTFLKIIAINILNKGDKILYVSCNSISQKYINATIMQIAKECCIINPPKNWNLNNCILILDGLDEAPFDISQKIIKDINHFSKVIISTRTAFKTKIRGSSFNISLSPFSEKNRNLFFKKWFSNDIISYNNVNTLISNNPDIDYHTKLPLIATITAFLIQNGYEPTTRSEIYNYRLELLLSKWDKARGVKRNKIDQPKAKMRFLKKLAFDVHSSKDRKRTFNERDILNTFEGILGNWGYRHNYKELINDLIVGSGIIEQETKDSYSFGHLTFQEHLAGEYIYDEKFSIQKICYNFLDDDWWREPLLFYASKKGDITDLIQYVTQNLSYTQYIDVINEMLIYTPYTSPGAIEIFDEMRWNDNNNVDVEENDDDDYNVDVEENDDDYNVDVEENDDDYTSSIFFEQN